MTLRTIMHPFCISCLTIAGVVAADAALAKTPPPRAPDTQKVTPSPEDDNGFVPLPTKKKAAKEKDNEHGLSLALFPDWQSPDFNWGIDPVFGVKMRQSEENGVKISSYGVEGGAAVRLSDIPLVLPNPGLTTTPYVGYALGHYGVKTNDGQTKTDNTSAYNRLWYGDDLTLYIKFFRDQLSVGHGTITYQKIFPQMQDLMLSNDAGILILPFFSTHYTLTSLELYRNSTSRPLLKQTDNWVHGRLFFNWHRFSLDLGPGYAHDKDYTEQDDGSTKAHATYDTSYLLAKQGMHLFWKIDMSAQAKYILKTQLKADDTTVDIIQLPYQGVNEPNQAQTMPADSIDAYLFVDARDIVAGFGIGWYYNTQVINNKKKDGRSRVVTTQQGYTVSYTFSF